MFGKLGPSLPFGSEACRVKFIIKWPVNECCTPETLSFVFWTHTVQAALLSCIVSDMYLQIQNQKHDDVYTLDLRSLADSGSVFSDF